MSIAINAGDLGIGGTMAWRSAITDLEQQIGVAQSPNDPVLKTVYNTLEEVFFYFPDKNSDDYMTVYFPFYYPTELTHKFVVKDLQNKVAATIPFGNVTQHIFDNFDGHLITDMRIEWAIGSITPSAGKIKYIENPALHIADYYEFVDTNDVLQKLTEFGLEVHGMYKVPVAKYEMWQEMIGQEIEQNTYVVDGVADSELIPMNKIKLVSPNTGIGSETETVGTVTFQATPNFAILTIPIEGGTGNETLPADLDSGDPTVTMENLEAERVSFEKTGTIVKGYDGLQTYKDTQPVARFATHLPFWFSLHRSQAFAWCALSNVNKFGLRFKVKAFNKLIFMSDGEATCATPTLTYQVNTGIVILSENISDIYTASTYDHVHNAVLTEERERNINQLISGEIRETIPYTVKEIFVALQDNVFVEALKYNEFHAHTTGLNDYESKKIPPYEQMTFSFGSSSTTRLYTGDIDYYTNRLIFYSQERLNRTRREKPMIGVIPLSRNPNSVQHDSYASFSAAIYPIFNINMNTDWYSTGFNIMLKMLFYYIVPVSYAGLQIVIGYLE